jgi:DNA-binding transcriptional LysR family regulator
VLELESLTLADTYEWLGTGSAAAEYLCCNQSTISRSIQKFRRLEKDLKESDCIDLLYQERSIHQRLRFAKGSQLRLHAYQWSNYVIRTHIPAEWTINPIAVSSTKKDVIDLIIDRKIDAAFLPYPLIADVNTTWIECIPILRSQLQLFTREGSSLSLERNLSRNDISSNTTLRALDFVPKVATECSKHIDASLFGENSVIKSDPTAK